MQHRVLVEDHAARPLYAGFDKDGGEVVPVGCDGVSQGRNARLVARQVGNHLFRQHAREHGMHALFGIADRHGGEGVAMIAAAEGQDLAAALLAPVHPELDRHLHGDLDADRAALGEEHPLQIARQQRRQPRSKPVGLLMGKPAEHYMRHGFELRPHSLGDMGMVVAMAGGPPACDAVDQFAPVGEPDARALRAGDRQWQGSCLHLRIGQPDMGPPGLEPVGVSHARRRHRSSCRVARTGPHRDPRRDSAWSAASRR